MHAPITVSTGVTGTLPNSFQKHLTLLHALYIHNKFVQIYNQHSLCQKGVVLAILKKGASMHLHMHLQL